jgi:hypothetical protein
VKIELKSLFTATDSVDKKLFGALQKKLLLLNVQVISFLLKSRFHSSGRKFANTLKLWLVSKENFRPDSSANSIGPSFGGKEGNLVSAQMQVLHPKVKIVF